MTFCSVELSWACLEPFWCPWTPAGLRYPWLPHPCSNSYLPGLCLITGRVASRLCVSIASCRPWSLGLPAPSLRLSLSGQPPRRRLAWHWMWAASTGAGRWLARLDGGHEEWGPVGRAGWPRLRAGPGVEPRAAQGVPSTESLLPRGCGGAPGLQGRPQGVQEQLGLRR
uniref:Uncharacterized protein n=1 Tax=Moschus moschiferus TaxID=68415 RepID=A0A8C6MNM8_MOSMO